MLCTLIGAIILSINIQVGLNIHLYDDIGHASSSLRLSTSSYFILIFNLYLSPAFLKGMRQPLSCFYPLRCSAGFHRGGNAREGGNTDSLGHWNRWICCPDWNDAQYSRRLPGVYGNHFSGQVTSVFAFWSKWKKNCSRFF